MMRLKKATFIIYITVAVLLLSSCGPAAQAYEELIEPESEITTYRRVERRDIGKQEISSAIVKGTDYCHFFEKSVKIKSINVKLGDYVKEGDILCEADIDSTKNEIEDLRKELALLEAEHTFDTKAYEVKKKILDLNEEYSKYDKNFGDGTQTDIDNAGNDILLNEEDKEYSDLLYEFKKEKINESIASLNKIVKEGVIKSRKSGYVTYIKDLKDSLVANPNENVVIITDYDDIYLESSIDANNYKYKDFDVKYALVEGEKIDITEFYYSDAEIAYFRAQGTYPTQRYKTTSEANLKAGDILILCFMKKNIRDVICIGNDSLKTDEGGKFVYVRKEDGNTEKRYVETGEKDDHYTEITSGLSEGEYVLYSQEEIVPTVSKETEIKLDDYVQIQSMNMEKAYDSSYCYANKQKGEIEEIFVKDGQEVKKGDALFKVKIDSKKSTIVELENDITSEDREHENRVTSFNERYEEYNKLKNDSKTDVANNEKKLKDIKNSINSGTLSAQELADANADKAILEDMINRENYTVKFNELYLEELEIERQREQKEHESAIALLKKHLTEAKKEDDGSGYETVYAVMDGTIKVHSSYKKGDTIEANTRILYSFTYSENKVRITDSKYTPSGYTFYFGDDDHSYEARCVSSFYKGQTFFFTIGDKVYGTTCTNTDTSMVAEVKDSTFFDNEIKNYNAQVETVRFNNIVLVPREFVFVEEDFEGKKSSYVWVLKNNEPCKEYISYADNGGLGDYMVLSGVNVGDTLVK